MRQATDDSEVSGNVFFRVAVHTISGKDDTLHWILSDHLGSANVTANADGAWKSEIRYSAFGEVRWKDGITPTKYRFTGQLEQTEVGLYYYVARFYDPYLNHFIQADTIVPQPGNPVTYDRYAYTRNNPIRFNDPSGHDVGCAGMDASKCRQGYGVTKAVLTQVWKEEAVETANKYLEKRKEGTTVNWNGLPSQEKSILERGG